jgi:serine/threonine protein kinase
MADVEVGNNLLPRPGAQPFGKYYLLERIGAGGMAEVFLAVAVGLEGFQRTLVIKRMLPHLSMDRSFVRMFIDEAKLSGLLSHPNLVQIFEFGKVDENFFIAMEHVDGYTLSAVEAKLSEAGRVAPIAASLEIARQVCLGLHYAHSLHSASGQPLGVVHRDISPSNLMLAFHGGVKILDFGIARVAEGLRDSNTQVGTMKGKVSYMSPEQVHMEKVDNRSDIFAVGIVLHEMLTGKRLFRATSEHTATRMVLEAPIPLPSTVNQEVPPAVDRVVMRALERDPAARYQTAGELGDDLEQALADLRTSPHPPQKLLSSLFPQRQPRTGELMLPITGTPRPPTESVSFSSPTSLTPTTSGGRVSRPGAADGTVDVDVESFGGPGTIKEGGRRRRWIPLAVAAAVAGAGGLVLALRPHSAPAPAPAIPMVTEARTETQPLPSPAPAVAPITAPAAKSVVQLSLDSSPQDAQVTREDTGETVGRTPLTITLPPSHDVLSFRFEKPGHSATSYKVIPDLDKVVRVDLAPEGPPPGGERRAAGPSRKAAAPARPSSKAARAAAAVDAAAAAAKAGHDCSLSIATFPWTELWIDGKDTGQRTPVVHLPVSCGPHKLGLRRHDLNLDRTEHVTAVHGVELKQHYELGDDYGE